MPINWNSIYMTPFKVLNDTKLLWFQFKINHRILGTNHILYKMGIKTSPLCSFCHSQNETIEHLFWDCTFSSAYWDEIKIWINKKCPDIYTDWSITDILLGNKKIDEAVINIFILAKFIIYRSKMQDVKPSFPAFSNHFHIFIKTEIYMAKRNNKMVKFDNVWSKYVPLMTN